MRDYTGIDYASLPQADHPDFAIRARNMLGSIDYFLRDLSKGVARIQQGEVPNGSGAPLVPPTDTSQFFYLPGRAGGQVAHSVDSNAILDFDLPTLGTSVTGATGTAFESFSVSGTVVSTVAPYVFDAATNDLAFKPGSAGGGVQFIPSDGTSGMRLLANAGRAFLQMGRKDNLNKVQESAMTIGGQGATVGNRLATEVQYIAVNNLGTVGQNNSTLGVRTCRLAINADPFDFSATASALQPDSLYLVPVSAGSGAPLTIEGVTNRNAIEIRGTPGGASPSATIGALTWSLDSTSPAAMTWWNGGTKQFAIRNNGSSDLSVRTAGASNSDMLRMRITNAFADTVLSQTAEIGDTGSNTDSPSTLTNRDVILGSSGGNVMARLGICATSTVLGPATFGVLPAPTNSRILTMCDSGGTVLAGHASDGSLFFKATETINLTAQAADIAGTTLSSTAGFYDVLAVLECTTSDGAAGSVILTISWTDDVGATTATATQVLTGTGRQTLNQPLYLASGNLTYAITHTGSYGTAKYALRIRCIPLG
jgi:hypothetical protein